MKKPIIFVIDDDPQVLRALQRDLSRNYSSVYRILTAVSGVEALESLKQLKLKNEMIALFLSDQRMPGLSGVEFLASAKRSYPDAKTLLLTAYSDINAAIKAINDVQLDYYLMKPWDPPEEKLFPVLDELLDDWQAKYHPEFEGIKLIGFQWSPWSHAIKEFLTGNLIPYLWIDVETSDKAKILLESANIDHKDLPAIFFEDGTYLVNPTIPSIANKIGLKARASEKVYDVIIVGAGPAGLAAAVYGASEGLKTLVIEKRAPGGQAGTSTRIENYLGFPSGLSGSELARRAVSQSTRLGAEFLSPLEVVNIELRDKYKIVHLEGGTEVPALSVIIATGVDYRQLDAKGIKDFTGAGVYYGAAMTEAHACMNKDVYIIGGGNSAGQSAMYLSQFAKNVYILIRRDSLRSSMSHYLIEQIEKTDNVTVLGKTEVVEARGDGRLDEIVIKNSETNELRTVKTQSLFIFIGTRPYTDWIKSGIIKNEKGFIETGRDLHIYKEFKPLWKLDREPYLLESSAPGIFAAGDVRAGSMNRVASAVGEGSMSIKFVHEYLAKI